MSGNIEDYNNSDNVGDLEESEFWALTLRIARTFDEQKEKLFKDKLLENKCTICGQKPVYMGKPLNLLLNHINGLYKDNRIENLRILCPCCLSQTETERERKRYKEMQTN